MRDVADDPDRLAGQVVAELLAHREEIQERLRGCSRLPSPALTIAASVHCVMRSGVPAQGARTTMASGEWAASVRTVSFSDSPFSTDEPLAAKLTVSAERRLAASSKELRVRVEAS